MGLRNQTTKAQSSPLHHVCRNLKLTLSILFSIVINLSLDKLESAWMLDSTAPPQSSGTQAPENNKMFETVKIQKKTLKLLINATDYIECLWCFIHKKQKGKENPSHSPSPYSHPSLVLERLAFISLQYIRKCLLFCNYSMSKGKFDFL